MAQGSPKVLAAAVDRGGTIGVGYLGVTVASLVYGITCTQTFQYYRSPRSKPDSMWLRKLVLVLWLLDTIQQVLGMHAFYLVIVDNNANPRSIPAGILVNAIISSIVKTFFIVRIWRLSRGNWFVTTTCVVFNLARLVMNTYFPILTLVTPSDNFGDLEMKFRGIGCAGLGLEVAADIMVSVPMVYYLLKERTGMRRSDDMIARLIMLSAATGMLSTLIATADLISLIVAPGDFYVLFFNLLIAKMDVNALLTSLNSRQYIREGTGSSGGFGADPRTIPLSAIDRAAERSRGSISDSRADDRQGIVCKVDIDGPYVV